MKKWHPRITQLLYKQFVDLHNQMDPTNVECKHKIVNMKDRDQISWLMYEICFYFSLLPIVPNNDTSTTSMNADTI